MSAHYEWAIEEMQIANNIGNNENVVVSAIWRCNYIDGNLCETLYGSVSFDPEDFSSFIPYNNITKESVIEWVKKAQEKKSENIEEKLFGIMEKRKSNTIKSMPVPWE